MECIGFERLIDYLDNRLPDKERQQIEAHLSTGCPNCGAAEQWYRRARRVMASDKSEVAPPWVLRRAGRLFESRRPAGPSVGRAARGVAQLLFDSFNQPARAGARFTGSAERQFLYSVGDYSIDLQIARSGEARCNVIGQVLSTSEPGFASVAQIPVELISKGKPIRSATTDGTGVFVLDGLDIGEYDLRIDTRDMTINVVGLPVSPSL